MNAERHYADDGLAPEHVQHSRDITRLFAKLGALESRVETLEQENQALWKRVKGNEAAAPY
jgi:hypothetical protein